MKYNELVANIKRKKSFLCVGLDPDIEKLPLNFISEKNPIFDFNKKIIDATAEYAIAYKPNTAFYECLGIPGWIALMETVEYIKKNYPDIFIIADAKRGDIGNTSKMYAKTFFESMNCHAVTVAPYMGKDSVSPFLSYEEKWVILLALTSNEGAKDFQYLSSDNEYLFEKVVKKSQEWASENNLMYVVGATQGEMIKNIRKIAANHFLLIPGVGAQGGSLNDVAKYGLNSNCGIIVNSSRGIIFADKTAAFDKIAGKTAAEIQNEMSFLLEKFL